MSNFDTAVLTVLKHEGFYSNDAADPGGATNFGISLRFLKSIGGIGNGHDADSSLYGDFDHDGDVDSDDIKKMTQEDAINLYRIHWWDKYQYDRIINQAIATKVFDLAINMGAKSSHICLQRAVRAAVGTALVEDGIIGSVSLQLINNVNPADLLAAYRSEAAGFYRSLNKSKYINGWLNRAYE